MYACVPLLWSFLFQLFLEWEMFQTKDVEKIETSILRSETFSPKSCRIRDKVENYGKSQTGHGWQYTTANSLPMFNA